MSLEQASAFVVFAAVAAITPGPSNIMLTATGAVAGVLRGMPCLLGVGAGMAVMMFAAAFGLGAVVLSHPGLTIALKWCGAAFLLWLAWKIATAQHSTDEPSGRPVGFFGAFAFQWINPKSWLVSTSAAAAFLQSDIALLGQALSIGALFFTVALVTGFLWLAFGVAIRRLLASPRCQRAFNIAMGALLALSILLFVL